MAECKWLVTPLDADNRPLDESIMVEVEERGGWARFPDATLKFSHEGQVCSFRFTRVHDGKHRIILSVWDLNISVEARRT